MWAEQLVLRSDEPVAKWTISAADQDGTDRDITFASTGRVGQRATGYWCGRIWFTSSLGGAAVAVGTFTATAGVLVEATAGNVYVVRTGLDGVFTATVAPSAAPATLYVWAELCGEVKVKEVAWV